jgi:hypothetical protein
MIEVTKSNLSHYLIEINNRQLILGQNEATELCLKLRKHLAGDSEVFSIPPDPALELAQRIASISAETGLKPRIVFNIVNHAYWEEKEALEAAAPQENSTDE